VSVAPPLLPTGVVRIDGSELPPELAALLVLLRVRDSLRLPDQAQVRFADPQLAHVDDELLSVGRSIEVLYAAPGASVPDSVFSGRIEAIELELLSGGAMIGATAYEPAFALHQKRRTQAFQNMTSGDIAEQVIAAAGLTARVGTAPECDTVHPFVLQSEETDWQLLWRLADAIGFEVVGDGETVDFRPADAAPAGSPLALHAGQELISFRPRLSASQQVEGVEVRGWDPVRAEAIIASESPSAPASDPGVQRSTLAAASGAGTWTIGDRTVVSHEEANALAASLASRLADVWVQADGVAVGNPQLRAGCQLQIGGVGSRFGGTYTVTSATHTLSGGRGYETHFSISGRIEPTFAELVDLAPATSQWGTSVVVGVVTQTDDPEELGRVRVQYPALGDGAEGWWARIAAPAAGTGRGLLMMPLAGDEVVLAFEQGDPRRPYVLGSVWNGQAAPGELVHTDGSFALASDKDISLQAGGTASLLAKGDASLTTQGGASIELGKDGSVTVKGKSIEVQASESLTLAASDSLKISASGSVQVSASEVQFG
jgi:uncharacterized protein involved in type VI secretion and phage assembly